MAQKILQPKNEIAILNPSLNNDERESFSIGSLWHNKIEKKTYICLDNTINNALWKLITLTDNNGNVVLPAGLQFSGGYSSAILSGNTNNLLINNLEQTSLIRIETTGLNYNLTGIVVPDDSKAFFFSIFNVGTSGNIIFKDNSASSLENNRFSLGVDVQVQPDEGLTIIYDPVSKKWRSPGKNI